MKAGGGGNDGGGGGEWRQRRGGGGVGGSRWRQRQCWSGGVLAVGVRWELAAAGGVYGLLDLYSS